MTKSRAMENNSKMFKTFIQSGRSVEEATMSRLNKNEESNSKMLYIMVLLLFTSSNRP